MGREGISWRMSAFLYKERERPSFREVWLLRDQLQRWDWYSDPYFERVVDVANG